MCCGEQTGLGETSTGLGSGASGHQPSLGTPSRSQEDGSSQVGSAQCALLSGTSLLL